MTAPIKPKLKQTRLSPILKWAGGKEQELKHIHPMLPRKIKNYYEPFVGGGAVYFSLEAKKMFINDRSSELINLYRAIEQGDKDFFSVVDEIIHNWKLLETIVESNAAIFINRYQNFSSNRVTETDVENWIFSFLLKHSEEFNGMFETSFNVNIENFLKEIKKNLISKMKRMKKIEKQRGLLHEKDIVDNFESAFKSAFYMHFRHLYNNIERYKIRHSFGVAIFFFIRNYAYSGMFRYNKKGDFNVPYGGIGYNRKNLAKKMHYLRSNALVKHLKQTKIENMDFEKFFLENRPKKDDFIFLDPPYDSEFSTYSQNSFDREDQKRLANFLLESCEANWMMVIKNTDFIYSLYDKEGISIQSFDKKYLVSFQNRNDKNAEHLIITNYR